MTAETDLLPLPEPFAWVDPDEAEDFIDGEGHHFTALRRGVPGGDFPIYSAGQVRACVEANTEALRELCGMAYQLAGVHDAPEKWLDALSNAAAGRPFSTDGLLPYMPQAVCDAEARAERLEKALQDAATSMQTIADKAGRDEYLMTTDEVRCYANSRANAARAALDQEKGQ